MLERISDYCGLNSIINGCAREASNDERGCLESAIIIYRNKFSSKAFW